MATAFVGSQQRLLQLSPVRGVSARRSLAAAVVLSALVVSVVLTLTPRGVSGQPTNQFGCTPSNYQIYRSGFGNPNQQYENGGSAGRPADPAPANERNYQTNVAFSPMSSCCGPTGTLWSCFPTITSGTTLPGGRPSALFPYGPNNGDSAYSARNDDGFMGPLSLNNLSPDSKDYKFKFYGTIWDHWYLGNNGILSFGSGVSSYSPAAMPVSGLPAMIAVFWADVDTRGYGGVPWYRVITTASQPAQMARYTTELRNCFLGLNLYTPTLGIIVTWDAVSYYPYNQYHDYLNTFQVVLLSDGFQSFALFNYGYKAQQWQIGTASGGVYPQVGFQDGGGNNYNAAATRTIAMRDLWYLSRAQPAFPGRQVHRIDGFEISQSPTFLSPDPNLSNLVANYPGMTQDTGPSCTAGATTFAPACKRYRIGLTPTQGLQVTPTEGVTGQYIRAGRDVGSASPTTTGTASTPAQVYSAGGQFFIVSLAPNTINETTYLITIDRLKGQDTLIASMTLAGYTYDQGAWSPTTFAYTRTVPSSVTTVDFAGTANDQFATIRMRQYGSSGNSFSQSSILLQAGANVFTFNCSAEDTRYWRIYTVTVTRQLSANTQLASVTATVDASPLTVTTTSNQYYVTVATANTAVTITGVSFDSAAFVGFPSPKSINTNTRVFSPLSFYTTNYQIEVQAENGAIQTYNLYVTRPPSANADLAAISLTTDLGDAVPLTFAAATTSYSVTVNAQVPSLFATATLAESAVQTMTLNSAALGSGSPSNAIALTASLSTAVTTTLTFVVTAQAGNTKTYTVTVTRSAPPTTAAQTTCNTPVVFNVRRNEYVTYRVTTSAASEVLHIDATSNISPGGAPDIWVRRGLLPNPAGSIGNGFITQSTMASAAPQFSSATVINATGATDWFVMFSPGSGTSTGGTWQLTVNFCQYTATPLLLNNAVDTSVARNRWLFYTTTTAAGATLPGMQYTAMVTSTGVTDKSLPFLRSWARVYNPALPLDFGSFFGPIDAAQNPSTAASAPNALFSGIATAPASNTRVVFGLYYPTADVAAVASSGAPNPVAINVKVAPVQPVIASVSPRNGGTTGGNVITITLVAGTSEPRVNQAVGASGSASIGGVPCTALAYDGQSRLLCTVPPGAGQNLAISVTLYGQTSPAFVQSYSYDPPTLTSAVWTVAPTAGGAQLTINGNNFGTSPLATVGGQSCTVTSSNPAQTQLICTTPAGEGTVQVVVSANGQSSTNARSYTYDAPFLLKQFAANTATAGGNPITIWGYNFGRSQSAGPLTVTIGNNPCTSPVSNQTVIVCTLPAGSGQSQAIVVTVATIPNAASSVTFAYQGPAIASIVPNPVPGLTTLLTIAGAQFGPLSSSMVVTLLGGTCTVTTRNDTHIFCQPPVRSVGLPANAYVTAGGQQSNTYSLLWEKPIITQIAPQVVGTAGGDLVLITGRNLFSPAGDNRVRFNGVDITPASGSTASVVRFNVPTNNPAGLFVPLLMSVGQQLSDAGTYLNFTKPNILSIAFSSGAGPFADGTATATFTGENFGPTGTVLLSTGAQCTASSWSSSQIVCQFPIGVATVTVTVVVAGQVSDSRSVTYLPPTVTGLNPTDPAGVSTAGGDTVQITGRNFGATQGTGSVVVRLGNGLTVPCAVVAWSDPSISCSAPVGNGTNLLVTVTQSGGATGSRAGLTYNRPTISSATAASFPTRGGSTLLLFGSSFDSSGSVTVNGAPCVPVLLWDNANGQIQCTLPPGGGNANPIVITSVANRASAGYNVAYDAPSISSIIPATLTTSGQVVTILGLNLGSNLALASVSVDGVSSGNVVTFANHTAIIFTLGNTPQSASTSIVVTYAGLSSSGYTVGLSAPTIFGLNPPNGPTGPAYRVTINGEYFGDGTRTTTVNFGTKAAQIISVASQSIVVWAPSFYDQQLVQVTVGTQNSNTRAFQYDRPSVTAATPNTGLATSAPLTNVTITGTSFGDSGMVVLLNGAAIPDTSIFARNHTRIVFRMPAGSGSGVVVSVKQSSQTSTESNVVLAYKGPQVTAILPVTGPTDGCSNYCLIISGSGFGPGGASAGTVSVGSQACAVQTSGYSDSQLQCNLPAGSGRNLNVVVTVNGAASPAFLYSYTAPLISGITTQGAASPAGGTTITFTGLNLGQTGVVSVVNGTATGCTVSNPSWWTSTTVQCVLGAGYGIVYLKVTVGGQDSNPLPYRFAAPTVNAFPVPQNGPTAGGTVIVLGGNNLGTTAGIITIGSRPCTLTNTGWTNTRIECTTPEGPGGADSPIRISIGGQNATAAFKWDLPEVYAVEPQPSPTSAGLVSQPVVPLWVRGKNFGDASVTTQISVAGGAYVAAVAHNHTHARLANTPNGVGQSLSVQVRVNGLTTSSALVYVLSYAAPFISSITSASCVASGSTVVNCPTAGGYPITITGLDLGSTASLPVVNIQGVSGNLVCASPTAPVADGTRIVCTMPAGVSSGLPLTVTLATLTSNPVLVGYLRPALSPSTLRLASGTGGGNLAVPNINGTQLIYIGGTGLNVKSGGTAVVRFGTVGAAPLDKEFVCTNIAVSGSTSLTCNLPLLAVGQGLSFVYWDGQQWSLESADLLSFPAPVIASSTIRLPGNSAGSSVTGLSSQGEFVDFGVYHIGNNLAYLDAFYDTTGGTFADPTKRCAPLAIQTSQSGYTVLRCRTQPGDGGPYVFKVKALNTWSAEGTDQYSYPTAPKVTRVQGAAPCVDSVADSSTANCPTTGAVRITLTGTNFQGAAALNSVLVGSTACLVVSASSVQIVCTLPAGTGLNVPVTVFSGAYSSVPFNKLSYAKALVNTVSGCAVNAAPTTTGCLRNGGDTLQITGTGFGPSGASVFVGATRCLPLTHVNDGLLTCTAPKGTALNATVLVIQSTGALSANNGLLSYAQCGTGRYQANTTDYGCTPCAAGTYADQTGLLACKPCPVGTASNLTAQVTCASCASGWFAPSTGLQQCTRCAEGTFTSTTGQGACTACPAQSFAAGTGNTGCTPCPAGSSTTATGAGSCPQCGPGFFTPSAGAGECQACPPGTFNTGNGNTGCTPCAVGSVQPLSGQTACTPCGAGYIAAIPGQVSCVACASGTFAAGTGNGNCAVCAAGTWSKMSGSAGPTGCSDCLAGTYLDVAGQADCLQCPKGRVSAGNRATSCEPCGLGKFASDLGLQVCTNCTAGRVASRTGLDVCELCPTGKYASFGGASTCTDCPVGTYNTDPGSASCIACGDGATGRGVVGPGTGQAACVACTPGYYMNDTRQTQCTPCAIGRYVGSSKATGCIDCAAGSFAPTAAAAVCQACAAGTFSSGTGNNQCTACSPGSVSGPSATGCDGCPAGQFAAQPGSATCALCPVGKFSNATGSPQCMDCPAGTQQPNVGATTCAACVAGKYTLIPAQAACFDCPVGSIAATGGLSTCSQCGVGRFAPSVGQAVCQACAPGTATNSQGQASCPSCVVGSAANAPGAATCSACTKGFYASGSNSSACQPCPAGSYAPLDGAISCQPCPVGQYQPVTGQTFCSQCNAGFVQPLPGRASCTPCAPGTVQANAGQVSCAVCPTGQFAAGLNNTQCALCAEGTANPVTSAASCASCTAGKYIDLKGAAACRMCPAGFIHNNVTFVSCAACPAGFARAEEGYSYCDACPTGKFAPAIGSAACSPCPSGSYADVQGLSQCKPCPAGSFCVAGATAPAPCTHPAISASTGQAQCTVCPSGQFINVTGATACILCSPGSFSGTGNAQFAGATVCSDCQFGKFTGESGLPQCQNCAAGTFAAVNGTSRCTQCAAGFYSSNTGSSVCTPAPAGTFVASPGQSLSSVCPFGTFSVGLNNTQCTPCAAGTFQNFGSAASPPTACQQCDAGSYSPAAGQQNCLPCDAGTFSNVTGQSSCYSAPTGRYAPAGAQSSAPCNPGTFAAVAGSAACLPCPARSYADQEGTVQCAPCGNGTYGNETGLAKCHSCPPGTFNDVTGQFACTPCQPGQYQTALGAVQCLACPSGTFSDVLSAPTCTSCPAGYYAPNEGSVQCQECPVGSFSNSPGRSNCTLCSPGTFQNDTAAQDCLPCAPGTANNFVGALQCSTCKVGSVAPGSGLLLCVPCVAGKYMPDEGQQTCLDCGLGEYNPLPGAAICSLCPKGTYQPYPGSSNSSCFPCAAGWYQSVQGQDHCVACGPGKFSAAERTEECSLCAAGTFNPDSQRTECSQCAAGTYQPQQAQLGCLACVSGKYTSKQGLTLCDDCPAGRVAPNNGSGSCDTCEFGLYQNNPGQTECLPCAPGSYANDKQLSSCFKCAPGTANNTAGATEACGPCGMGTYAAAEGQTNCTLCEAGKYYNLPPTSTGALSCLPCPQGRFSNFTGFGVGGGECYPCEIGTFNADTGRSACDLCPFGTYNPLTAQKQCTPCGAGSYSSTLGLTECHACDRGTYTNENTGRVQCALCAAGKHASGNGTENCQACVPGYFADSAGFIECAQCAQGKFTGIGQSVGCSDCPAGRYQDEPHAIGCKSCAPGTANNKTGQPLCAECPAGYYQDSTDAYACLPCPTGRFVNVPGQASCVSCAAGSYADAEGSTECLSCAQGYFQPDDNQATCLPCQPGFYSTPAQSSCLQCAERLVAPRVAAFQCYACDEHATTDAAHTLCLCEIGYAAKYRYNNATGINEATCELCPTGSVCDTVGTEFDTMQRASGYWCAENGVYYQCLIETDCPQGSCATASCAAGSETCTACANGRTGPLCAYCMDGWTVDSQGHCNECSSDKTSSYIYTILIIVAFGVLLIIGCYVMLRSSANMMDIAAREDEKMRLKNEGYIQNFNEGFLDDQWRFGRYITLAGAPPPKPDFTFKLKILLGFVQIITNLAIGLNIQWPTAFKAFLQAMNPANLDFVKFSSIDCLRRPSYYDQLILFALVPPLLLVLLIVLYFIPQSCRNLSSTNEGRAWRKRIRRSFWKLLLFLLFLVYPTVSATVLRLYVCIDVEGVSYLRADLTTQCHTDEWNRAAYGNIILVVLYPVMIPVFFLLMLMRYRKRLDQSGVRAELGFLYDGYERSFYLFELVDMIHKLGITSLVAFLPDDAQLRVAMSWVTLYLIIILWRKPYIRKGDDILHLFVQVEVMLLLLAGWVFTTLSGPDDLMDAVLSVVLIAAVCGLFAYFLLSALNVFVKWLRHTECAQNWSCLRVKEDKAKHSVGGSKKDGQGGADANTTETGAGAGTGTGKAKKKALKPKDLTIAGEMRRLYRIDRHTLREHGRVATARGHDEQEEVAMVRNAMWGDAELAKASFAQMRAASTIGDGVEGAGARPQGLAADLVRSPRASTNLGNAPVPGVLSPRRALLAHKLGDQLPAGTPVPAPTEQLMPLTPGSPERGVEMSNLGAAPMSPNAAAVPIPPEPLFSTGEHPASAAAAAGADQQRGSVADLAQPLGTTPAGAPAAIELQAVTTAAEAPIQLSEIAPAVAPVPSASFAAAEPLPVDGGAAEARASVVADVPVVAPLPALAAFEPIQPIGSGAAPAAARESVVAEVPSVVAAVPTFEPLPQPKEL